MTSTKRSGTPLDRVIALGDGLPAIPEKLLLAHADGKVLFIAGAGISMPSNMPSFRRLVIDVYEKADPTVHAVIKVIPPGVCNLFEADMSSLTNEQRAEVRRFIVGDYDVVLGMLERRIDEVSDQDSIVRKLICDRLRTPPPKPSPIHKALMTLSDRGGATTIVTTNFDLLLEDASAKLGETAQTYSLGGIPRPGLTKHFSGVLHIHGALDRKEARSVDLVVSDQDFGEYYLRRRVVPDLIYDAARLFHIVLVGYSANDPPMRYLLNAVAADGVRFDDLKWRYTFVGDDTTDAVALADWHARGIIPIQYSAKDGHSALLHALQRWAELSAINGKKSKVDAELRRIVRNPRKASNDPDRDLFDHLFRRGDRNERIRLTSIATRAGADIDWLDGIDAVLSENRRGR